ncbi:MAG TPA: MFS transporter, partial [Armatimonadota bacterium]|nr:MFS transporter [Armatimonadota bacterium]
LMPTYFHEVQGVTKPIASILLTIHLLGIAAGRLCSVPLNRRISNHMLIGGCLLAGLAIFPVLTCHSPFVLYPALFLVGVMFSCVWPTYFAQVSQFYQGDQDFFAYSALLGDAIGTAGCVYISSLIADFSLPFSLLFCTGVFWLFGLLYFSSRLSRSPVHSSEHTASIPETSE